MGAGAGAASYEFWRNARSHRARASATRRLADFARRANVPHPVGIAETPKSVASFHPSCFHKEGRFAIVTNVGSGMRWTQSIEARSSCGRAMSLRTAKSYGPGAPTLALSWR